jgi:hypothetical protein
MPFPSIEKACPNCLGNLHYQDTIRHPHRRGYEIHSYRCLDCGPMVYVTQLEELNTMSLSPEKSC